MLGFILILIVLIISSGIQVIDSFKNGFVLKDTTKIKPLFKKNLSLFDNSTGNFYYRVYDNYNYYYYPPLSSRYYLSL